MTSSPAPHPLARRVYGAADQDRFAALSGDRNPMHVDPVAARRLLTGRQVVHGVHTLLTALELWPGAWPGAAWRVEADFLNPVSVGEAVDFRAETDAIGAPLLVAVVKGLPCCRVAVRTAEPPRPPLAAGAGAEGIVVGADALDRDATSWVGRHQQLTLPAADFVADFPIGTARIGAGAVAAFTLLSTYVGMVCPGLHSVFSALSAEAGDPAARGLVFEVRRYDPRLRLFTIVFDGVLRGELRAFLRAPAQTQPGTTALRAAVTAGEFAGTQHWVIGGSRGLGELVAKLAAAGGAQVTLSHAFGAADAERVVQDIVSAGTGSAQTRHLDLLQDGAIESWLRDAPWPDAVWYFATPRIFRKKAAFFDAATFDEFVDFYVRRFESLCQALEAAAQGRSVTVFYPSTAFVEDRPKGMTEYAMAKAAAEVLIADLTKRLRHVKPVAHRLPRLATDQTAGLFATVVDGNAQVLLPVMRELLKR
jgi:hypothetical protein